MTIFVEAILLKTKFCNNMDYRAKTFKVVIEEITTYFITQRKVSNRCILTYRTIWNKLESFLQTESIEVLDTLTCMNFLTSMFGNKDCAQLSSYERSHIKVIHDLIEFLETGMVQRLKSPPCQLSGSIGFLMEDYIQHRLSMRVADQTAYMYRLYLSEFLLYLDNHNISTISDMNQVHILIYIKTIETAHEATIRKNIVVIRCFFRYLYDKNILSKDYSRLIPKDGYKNRSKLPSTYNEQEISKLLESIDRGNAVGKRDYAIILLAARLGLRASDIAKLKFSQLNWEQNYIQISQFKTGEALELPLLPEVGNAIIDYIKYGRPQIDLAYVFIIARSPYTPLLATSVYTIVRKSFERAKINTANKKRGPHALRHSLAGLLLERKSTLPVISEILGHKSTESTKYYLSIDLCSLRSCALDVPPVSGSFYMQKGGYFYE